MQATSTAATTITKQSQTMSSDQLNTYMSKVYLWLIIGLSISGFVAYYLANAPYLDSAILESSWCFTVIFSLQLVFCIFFRKIVSRLTIFVSTLLYMFYSVLTGIVLSLLANIYTTTSIEFVFFATAVGFFGLSAFGLITRRNLNGWGTFFITGLFGLISIYIAALFLPSLRSNSMQMALSALGVIIFSGLTAYDTYKIKCMAQSGSFSGTAGVLNGAFLLYLDFINLFLDIIFLFAKRK
jgi:uncharacterized protein